MPTPQSNDEEGARGYGQYPNGDVGLSEDGRISGVSSLESSATHVGSGLAVDEQQMPTKPPWGCQCEIYLVSLWQTGVPQRSSGLNPGGGNIPRTARAGARAQDANRPRQARQASWGKLMSITLGMVEADLRPECASTRLPTRYRAGICSHDVNG